MCIEREGERGRGKGEKKWKRGWGVKGFTLSSFSWERIDASSAPVDANLLFRSLCSVSFACKIQDQDCFDLNTMLLHCSIAAGLRH